MQNKYPLTLLENGTLGLATLVFGVMAGFFWTYTFNVNLAMMQVDGETYARMQSLFNQNVRHPMFFAFFFGGGLFSIIALLANLRQRKTLSFWFIMLAAATYIGGVIIFTKQVNLPLNYYTESWVPTRLPDDWMETRNSWNDANAIRVATSFLPFLFCISALVMRTFNQGGTAKLS
ncbi:DUF1772 domain-containing protein [Hahella aquimaris]|uniref:DUF1772 domain-containing protein n=1 Tax=Hahella sp. HNIBRBA332 TaxID=3015983 RepID=UPI00273BDF0E|nr:DUF1772 domain-containing protein [Hahella sp. HNIBRBA332]WLQ16703.1 DUF1772 domain-containing protein [Hahella sp. HNIBRBA332]